MCLQNLKVSLLLYVAKLKAIQVTKPDSNSWEQEEQSLVHLGMCIFVLCVHVCLTYNTCKRLIMWDWVGVSNQLWWNYADFG